MVRSITRSCGALVFSLAVAHRMLTAQEARPRVELAVGVARLGGVVAAETRVAAHLRLGIVERADCGVLCARLDAELLLAAEGRSLRSVGFVYSGRLERHGRETGPYLTAGVGSSWIEGTGGVGWPGLWLTSRLGAGSRFFIHGVETRVELSLVASPWRRVALWAPMSVSMTF
jgi:hypothetical protein